MNVENLEGAAYGTEDGIIKGPDGDVLGATNGSVDRRKHGGSTLGRAMVSKGGSRVVSYDEIPEGNIFGKIEGY